jgi:hypothetical protein
VEEVAKESLRGKELLEKRGTRGHLMLLKASETVKGKLDREAPWAELVWETGVSLQSSGPHLSHNAGSW